LETAGHTHLVLFLVAAKILIVDDHSAICEGLAVRSSAQPDLEVCGQAADTAEAMNAPSTVNSLGAAKRRAPKKNRPKRKNVRSGRN
jgi:hypothetical protein